MRFLLLTLLALLLAPPVAGQGGLSFDRAEHDFGLLEAEDVVLATFSFVNVTDEPVSITRVDASCGCTVSSFTREAVPPGASGEVVVGFDPAGRSGSFRQSVYVVSERASGEPQGQSLFVAGRVQLVRLPDGVDQGGVRFDSEVHEFGMIESGGAVQHRFLMHRTGSTPLNILSAHSFPAGATVRYPRIPISHGDLVRIEVTLDAVSGTGPLDIAIALETDDADEPVKLLRMVGTAR